MPYEASFFDAMSGVKKHALPGFISYHGFVGILLELHKTNSGDTTTGSGFHFGGVRGGVVGVLEPPV